MTRRDALSFILTMIPTVILSVGFAMVAGLVPGPNDCRAQENEGRTLIDFSAPDLSIYLGGKPDESGLRGGVEFRIRARPGASFDYFQLEKPNRLVIDVPGAKLQRPEIFTIDENIAIRRVRVGVYPDKTRIVVDLNASLNPYYEVRDEGDSKVFVFHWIDSVKQPWKETEEKVVIAPATSPTATVAAPGLVEPTLPPAEEIPTVSAPSVETPEAESTPAFTPVFVYPAATPPEATPALEITPVVEPARPLAPVVTPESAPPIQKSIPTVSNIPEPELEEPVLRKVLPEESPEPAGREGEENKKSRVEASVAGKPVQGLSGISLHGFKGVSKIKIPTERLEELSRINFNVDKMLLQFRAGERLVQNLQIKNPGTKAIYVSAISQEIKNAGQPGESRVDSGELLVAPRRFSIEPGQERTIRVVLRESPITIERAFQIAFSVNKDSFDAEFIDVEMDGKNVKLRVVTNLGVLVLASPPSPAALVAGTRRDGDVTLSNQGNISVRLVGGKLCKGNSDDCLSLPPKRLYPGNSWTLKVPADLSLFMIKDSVLGFEQFFLPPGQ